MIKVSVEVREGATPFRVAVQAQSISQAVSIIEGRHPGRDVRVVFPIDPERFFPEIRPEKTEGNTVGSYSLTGHPQQEVR
jgi:hypothetical protein